jgi:hypothetical protein
VTSSNWADKKCHVPKIELPRKKKEIEINYAFKITYVSLNILFEREAKNLSIFLLKRSGFIKMKIEKK